MKRLLPMSLFFLLILFLITVPRVTAQQTTDIPGTISYQGQLTTHTGAPIADGEHQISVTIYADENGSEPLWTETYRAQTTAGIFNLYLGSQDTPLPTPDLLNRPLWVGTSVDGTPEMYPLTPLSASPYALNVPDAAISSAKLAAASVTSDKVDMDYISEVRINGERISGKGTILDLRSSDDIALKYDKVTKSIKIESASRLPNPKNDDKGGPTILASPDAWNTQGDLTNGTAVLRTTGDDWIGTTANPANASFDFETRVQNQRVMLYQPGLAGPTPNIVGGFVVNAITGTGSVVSGGGGAGSANTITGDYDAVGGGAGNTIDGIYDVISGGLSNIVLAGDHSVIGGGQENFLNIVKHSTIGGGEANNIQGTVGSILNHATVSGGLVNRVFYESDYASIGGGRDNTILSSPKATISGGKNNQIFDNGDDAVIGGGIDNEIRINSHESTIGGGRSNIITENSSVISGGTDNEVHAEFGSIGGGEENVANGEYATIPGGDNLSTTASYAQTAIGFFNKPRGAMSTRPSSSQIAGSNDPLFMVGNGTSSSSSNAFEVSYNGHSVVTDENGPTFPGGRAPIQGATYTDNIIYAWADVEPTGAINSDFGVESLNRTAVGTYVVKLHIKDRDGNSILLNDASITATIVADPSSTTCGMITTTRIGPRPGLADNEFIIKTYSGGPGCTLDDLPFMFKVTGRPQ